MLPRYAAQATAAFRRHPDGRAPRALTLLLALLVLVESTGLSQVPEPLAPDAVPAIDVSALWAGPAAWIDGAARAVAGAVGVDLPVAPAPPQAPSPARTETAAGRIGPASTISTTVTADGRAPAIALAATDHGALVARRTDAGDRVVLSADESGVSAGIREVGGTEVLGWRVPARGALELLADGTSRFVVSADLGSGLPAGSELHWSVDAERIKETIVLPAPPSSQRDGHARLEMSWSSGPTPVARGDGTYVVGRYVLEAPFVIGGGPTEPRWEMNGGRLALVLPPALLDPALYPMSIDPSVVTSNSSNVLAGRSACYAHSVSNDTGGSLIFTISATTSQADWSVGVFSESTCSTAETAYTVAGGASGNFWVKVTPPALAAIGTSNTTTINATWQSSAWTITSQAQFGTAIAYSPSMLAHLVGTTQYLYQMGGNTTLVQRSTVDGSNNIGAWSSTGQGQLPLAIDSAAALKATLSGTTYFYYIGGSNAGCKTTVYRAVVDASGNVGAWDTTGQGQLPAGRCGPAGEVATIGGTTYLYITGGHTGGNVGETTVWRAALDASGNVGAWSATGQGQLGTGRQGHQTAVATTGGTTYLYAISGRVNGTTTTATIERAAIDASGNVGTWSTTGQGSLPAARENYGETEHVIAGTTHVFVVGGGAAGATTVYHSAVDPSGNLAEWNTDAVLSAAASRNGATGWVSGSTYYMVSAGGNSSGTRVERGAFAVTGAPVTDTSTVAAGARLYMTRGQSHVNTTYNAFTLGPQTPSTAANSATQTTANNFLTAPCEYLAVNGTTITGVVMQTDAVGMNGTDHCIASFFSPPLGQAISFSSGATGSLYFETYYSMTASTWTGSQPNARLRLYAFDGVATYTLIGTLNTATLGTAAVTNVKLTARGTPSANVTVPVGGSIVGVLSLNQPGSEGSAGTDTVTVSWGSTGVPGFADVEGTVVTPNKPDLTGSADDDFTTIGSSTCPIGGSTYNTKWTCLTPSATAGDLNAAGDTSQWLWLRNKSQATPSNFGTTPSNTYMYQSIPAGDGTVRTVVNIPADNSGSSAGVVLWTSNTDYLVVEAMFDGTNRGVRLNNSGTLSNSTALSTYGRTWLGWSKTGTSYQAQYSTDGSTWTNLGSAVSHPTAFTRMGLNVFSATTGTDHAAAFEWFDADLSNIGSTLTPNNTGNALAGTTKCYSHTLTNTGGAQDTFNLTFSNDQPGWTATSFNSAGCTGAQTAWTLNASANATVYVQVSVPGGATLATVNITTITSTSTLDSTKTSSATDTTTVVAAATISPVTPDQAGAPGTTVCYQLTLTNNQASTDTIGVSTVQSQSGWTTTLWDSSDCSTTAAPGGGWSVASGASQTFYARVSIPVSATVDNITTFTARVANNTTDSGTATRTTSPAYGVTAGFTQLQFTRAAPDASASHNALTLSQHTPRSETNTGPAGNTSTTPPCEASTTSSSTTGAVVNTESVGLFCLATFYSPPIGRATMIRTTDTNSLGLQLYASNTAGDNSTVSVKVRLYKYDGNSYTQFAEMATNDIPVASTRVGVVNASGGTPTADVTLAATDRVVAVLLLDVTVADSSSGTDTNTIHFGDATASSKSYISMYYAYVTPNKPSLTGTGDDDFGSIASGACSNSGLTYNTKWTCLTPNGNGGDLSSFNSQSWMILTNASQTTPSNFGTTPTNTYLYQTMPSGDGSLRTVANSAFDQSGSSAGLLLWTSDTDYVIVEAAYDGATRGVRVNNSGTPGAITAVSNYSRIWLGVTKSGTSYQPEYSTDGSTWNSLGSAISHPTAFTRTGLNVYSGTTGTDYSAAFEWFDASFIVTSAAVVGPSLSITAGMAHSCALLTTGHVRCWGRNAEGQLGLGHTNPIGDNESPTTNVDLGGTKVSQVEAGGNVTCAVLSTGNVRCWGQNAYGQLGIASTATIGDNESPTTDVNLGGTAVTQIAPGPYHTCALLVTGNVRCWGRNGSGQLGLGNTTQIGDNESPTTNVNLGGTAVKQVVVGSTHTCALLVTGNVRCWGANGSGQLGLGHTTTIGDNESPTTDVNLGGTSVVQITAGAHNVCALLATGNVRCWGANNAGQLGLGNTTMIGDNESPTTDVNLGGAKVLQVETTVSFETYNQFPHVCVLLSTNAVRCWGYNFNGQLGIGNTTTIGDTENPTTNVNLGGNTVTMLAAGGGYDATGVGNTSHTCAVFSGGNVRCWGANASGQLGIVGTSQIGDNENPTTDVSLGGATAARLAVHWADPGASVCYRLYLANTGDISDSIGVTLSNDQGWTATRFDDLDCSTAYSGPWTLAAGALRNFSVQVSVPALSGGAPAAGLVNVTTVTSMVNGNSSVSGTGTTSTTVGTVAGVTFSPDRTGTAQSPGTKCYVHTLTNNGNASDTYNITRSDDQSASGWTSAVYADVGCSTTPQTAFTVAANASTSVYVKVTVPSSRPANEVNVTTVTATSTNNSTVTASATETTTVVAVSLTFTPNNSQSVNPGATPCYSHTLTNTGSMSDTFTVTRSDDQGWTSAVYADSGCSTTPQTAFTLAPAASTSVYVKVTVPALSGGAPAAGTVNVTTVTATSGNDAAVSASRTDTTTVNQVAGVTLTPNNSDTGSSPSTKCYSHTLQNTGNATDTFTVTRSDGQSALGWTSAVYAASGCATAQTAFTVAANATVTVYILVTIPAGRPDNEVNVTTVTATSGFNGAVTASATSTTTVSNVVGTGGTARLYLHRATSEVDSAYNALTLTPQTPTTGSNTAALATFNAVATPCEAGAGVTSSVTGITIDTDSTTVGEKCLATFYSLPVGQSLSVSTADTNSLYWQFYVTSTSADNSTIAYTARLYKYDGSSYTLFATLIAADTPNGPQTNLLQSVTGTPSSSVTLSPGHRVVAVVSANITKLDTDGGADTETFIFGVAGTPSYFNIAYQLSTPNRPTLYTTSADDDFTTAATGSCSSAGLVFNSKWTCLTPSGNAGDLDAGTAASQWIWVRNKSQTTPSYFGTTPTNTYLYQSGAVVGDGEVVTIVNAALDNTGSTAGIVLWTSNTDHLTVEVLYTGTNRVVRVMNSGTAGTASAALSTYGHIWLRWTKTGTSYQAAYSLNGSSWTNIGSSGDGGGAYTHATPFTRLGLNVYSATTGTDYAAAFEHFSSSLGRVLAGPGALSTGAEHNCVRLSTGNARCWGYSANGQLGLGHTQIIGDNESPTTDVNLGGTTVTQVAVSAGHTGSNPPTPYGHSCAVLATGQARCWGLNFFGQLGLGHTNNIGDAAGELPVTTNADLGTARVNEISLGPTWTCARLSTGNVRCWGVGGAYLGLGHTNTIGDDAGDLPILTDVNLGGTAVAQIDSGSEHTCAVFVTGDVRCWGTNGYGQLGLGHINSIGDDESPNVNVNLGALTAVQVSAGGHHTCAVLATGDVRCWGLNDNGQLGLGHTNEIGDDESPSTNVNLGGTTVVQVAAGNYHTCALLTSGAVRCWGRNNEGQLGIGNTTQIGDNESPTTDVNLGGVSVLAVQAGDFHTCALLVTSNVRCWGYNANGNLGLANSPTAIGDNESPTTDVNLGGLQVLSGQKAYAAPNAKGCYSVIAAYTGGGTDTIGVAFSGNSWTAATDAGHCNSGAASALTLQSGWAARTWVEVDVPGSASDGSSDTVTITSRIKNQQVNGSTITRTTTAVVSASATVTTTVDQTISASGTACYTLTLTNTGSITDTIGITLSGNAWSTALKSGSCSGSAWTSASIGAGENVTVYAVVTPNYALDTDTVTYTARVSNNTTNSGTATNTTTSLGTRLYLNRGGPDQPTTTYNSMHIAGPDRVDSVATGSTAFSAPPCEASDLTIARDISGVPLASTGEYCFGTFYSPPVGTSISVSTAHANSLRAGLYLNTTSADSSTSAVKVRLYKFDGSSYTLFATATKAGPWTTASTYYAVFTTPTSNVTLAAGDRVVAVVTVDVTAAQASNDLRLSFNTVGASLIDLAYALTTPNRPADLSGAQDDDFTTNATTTCPAGGVTYNTKWTCVTPNGTAGYYSANITSWSWLWLWNTEHATPSNFGTTPTNTYIYQSMPSGNVNIRTAMNMPFSASDGSAAGLVLWASNTDYLLVQARYTGTSRVVEVVNSGTTGADSGALTTHSHLWLGIQKMGTNYQPQYSTDGFTWNDLGSAIAHTTAFTRAGLNVYSASTLIDSGFFAAFEWFEVSDAAVAAVTLTPNRTSNANSGTTVCYEHTLTNTGSSSDTFTLTFANNQSGWSATSFNSPGCTGAQTAWTLGASASTTVYVRVTVPGSAPGGQVNITTTTATSGNDTGVSASATATTTVNNQYGVDLASNTSGNSDPGSNVCYSHTLTNTGNSNDTYNITHGNTQGSGFTVTVWDTVGCTGTQTTSFAVNAGLNVTVYVRVAVASGIAPGIVNTTTVTATSQADGSKTDAVTERTVVNQLLPELACSAANTPSAPGLSFITDPPSSPNDVASSTTISMTSNALRGYKITVLVEQVPTHTGYAGTTLPNTWGGTASTSAAWSAGEAGFGYSLDGRSTYYAFDTATPRQIASGSGAVSANVTVEYRTSSRAGVDVAGIYTTRVHYVCTPIF